MKPKQIGLFSGGKDSLVACHLMQDKLDGVLYCKTGIGLDENVAYVKDTCQTFGWKLEIVEPKKGETYADFIRKFGFPHSGIHSSIMGYLKWHPMRKFARENPCTFVSGRRKKESRRRTLKLKSDTEHFPREKMSFYSPLYSWTTRDVFDYIKRFKLRLCPVYDTLHMSGDCLCGAFSESGEAELIATFHSYMAERIKILEQTYGGRWGNQSSITGAMQQSKISSFVCAECINRQ
ncbi:MAG TPA: phosphoadenosine phosphosulfate reductase family protein [Nitrososphaeraceae archaeon]|nr:phosphoadenosine phosphosulfate reductase family protein [Nitrososphaeraceae archaeon]